MTRVLVLGGGGQVGIGWEVGVLAGLADAGLELRAERVVGTSAGAIVGAQVAAGQAPSLLYDRLLAAPPQPADAAAPRPDMAPLFGFLASRPAHEPAPPAMLAQLGRFALSATAAGEEDFVAAIGRMMPETGWPDSFSCTAVEVETGAFRVWTVRDGVELARAVASSCAVPGLFPPVTLDGRRYMDGGMRSSTNGDLAAEASVVLMLAVTVPSYAAPMAAAARRELDALERAGTRTALVVPDPDAHAAFGPNLMDEGRRAPAAEAGRVQGRQEAARIAALWHP